MVPGVGIEPTRPFGQQDLNLLRLTNFATRAFLFSATSTAMMRSKTVTVGTENSKILYPIIIVVTIDVVKLEWQKAITSPLCPAALLAVRRFQLRLNEAMFQFVALEWAICY